MRVLGQGWDDGYLDETLRPGTCRIAPAIWIQVAPVRDAYFVRPRSWRLLFNYWREIGIVHSLHKVASRVREKLRNEKFASCGVGRVIAADPGSGRGEGDTVLFVAPNHPPAMERVVLPGYLTRLRARPSPQAGVLHGATGPAASDASPCLTRLAGWSADSGAPPDLTLIERALDEADRLLETPPARALLPSGPPSAVRERSGASSPDTNRRPSAVLFGLGNYAKTIILPAVKRHLDVRCIHELDPTQIGKLAGTTRVAFDTSPTPRPEEHADAWLIAGYHHMHAALAAEALRRGSAAVIEKPLATTRADLELLSTAHTESGGRIFACFQRRYLRFNEWARRDLKAGPADPISYHCIVYEVPLPRLHWYRWPASRTRILSNGCHWLDHFLFLNGFSEPTRSDVRVSPDGTAAVFVELANGAVFTMTLTDRGSMRIGLQDHTELRCNGVTVTIANASEYRSEDPHRILRSARRNRLAVYSAMYSQIARDIATGRPGDDPRTVVASARLALELDERVAAPAP